MTRSNFPNSVDSLPELSNILASDKTNVDRYKALLMQATRTTDEETELNNLKTTLANKLIDAEHFNFLSDAITAVQNYFLNQVMADIQATDVGTLRNDLGLPSNLQTYDKTNVVNAVNEVQNEIDIHTSNMNNPHNVTANQVGAYSKTEAEATFAPKTINTFETQITAKSGINITGYTDGKAINFPSAVSVYLDQYGNVKGQNKSGSQFWTVTDGANRNRMELPVGNDSNTPNVYKGYGSGQTAHDFYHIRNGVEKWVLGTYRSNDDNSIGMYIGGGPIFKFYFPNNRFEFRTWDDLGWHDAMANTFTNASKREWKKNIESFQKNGLDIINNASIQEYNMKTEEDGVKKHIGLIADEAPIEVLSVNGDGVDTYSMVSISWKAIQEMNSKIQQQENEIADIKEKLAKVMAHIGLE